MQPGIRRDSEGLTGLNGVSWQRPANGSSDPNDERNLDYCGPRLNPLKSHHSESGRSTLLKTEAPVTLSTGRGRVWGSSAQGRRSWVSWWNRSLYSDPFVPALEAKRTATLLWKSSFSHQHDFPGWPKSGDGQRSTCLTSQLKSQQELSLSWLGIIPGLLHKLKELFWPPMSFNKP